MYMHTHTFHLCFRTRLLYRRVIPTIFPPSIHVHLTLFNFIFFVNIAVIKLCIILAQICISPTTNDFEHIFICLDLGITLQIA